MKSPTEKCCDFIKYLKNEKKMKQIDIEDMCKIPRGSIGKWLSNDRKSLSAENISRVLIAFPELSADWMMRNEDDFPMYGRSEDSASESALMKEVESLKEQLAAAHEYIAVLLKSR